MALEVLNYRSPEGCIAYGQHRAIVACGSSTQLTAEQSGALVLLDTAAGSTMILPASPVAGMKFTAAISTTVTSNSHIIKAQAGVFLLGALNQIIDTSATSEGQFLNGTSHLTLTMNGTTTGGILGSVFELVCISSAIWVCYGIVNSSGTLATPATT